MDGLKGVAMGVTYLVESFCEVLHQVKAVRDLDNVGAPCWAPADEVLDRSRLITRTSG